MLKRVSSFVKPSGYLYIEVPQDLTDAELAELKTGATNAGLPVHEHINFFCIPAITNLMKAAGLDLIGIRSDTTNLGWITSTIIRALCQPSR